MSSERKSLRLGDIAEVVTKGTTPTTLGFPFVATGVNFVKSESISGGRIDKTKFSFISEDAHAVLKRSQLREGDILFSMAGIYIGKTAVVKKEILPANTNQAVGIIRLKSGEAVPEYVDYCFRNPAYNRYVNSLVAQSAQPNLNLAEIRGLPLSLPPIDEQNSVVSVLGALDRRVDLLAQTNESLEVMAGLLFKSWFIDFDPVRAKSEDREPEGMSADIAALFPSEFVDSEVGPIPKGWVCAPFGKTISVLGGGTPKTSVAEYWNGDLPWFSVVDAPADGQVFTTTTEKRVTQAGVDNSSAKIMPPWTTIISARGTVGKLAMTAVPMAMNQSCYGLRPFDGGSEPLVYLSAQRLVADLKRLAHGGVFDTITRDTLNSVMVASPPSDIESAFDSLVRPLFEKALVNRNMVDSLVETRNLLLPRLISGRISVSLCEVDV